VTSLVGVLPARKTASLRYRKNFRRLARREKKLIYLLFRMAKKAVALVRSKPGLVNKIGAGALSILGVAGVVYDNAPTGIVDTASGQPGLAGLVSAGLVVGGVVLACRDTERMTADVRKAVEKAIRNGCATHDVAKAMREELKQAPKDSKNLSLREAGIKMQSLTRKRPDWRVRRPAYHHATTLGRA
jgi:hypothetical protein